MATYKTESSKGIREYSPKKTIALSSNSVSDEQKDALQDMYKEALIARIKVFKPVDSKEYGDIYENVITSNQDLENPIWSWSDEGLKDLGIWQLRDLAILLENKKEKGIK